MSYDLNKWVENDLAARGRPWLRWMCLLPFATLPVAAALEIGMAPDAGTAGLLATLLTLVGLAGVLASFCSPYAAPIWRPGRGAPGFDEREREIVAKAHARAFAIVSSATMLAFLYAWAAMRWDWWLVRDVDDLGALFRAVVFCLVTLPVALAEWSVPPLPTDSLDADE